MEAIDIPIPITPSQFVGVPYFWGSKDPSKGLDCFSTVNWVLWTLKGEIIPGFDWIYQKYPNEVEAPPRLAKEQAEGLYGESEGGFNHLDMVLINWHGTYGLGVIFEFNGEKLVIYSGKSGSTFVPLSRVQRLVKGCWNPFTKTQPAQAFP